MNVAVSILNRDERDVLTYFINYERLSKFIIFELPHIQHALEDEQVLGALKLFKSITTKININKLKKENNDRTLNYNNNFESISWTTFELFDDTDVFIELPAKIDFICEYYDE